MNNIVPQIVRSENDGVEFYTVNATGESGMSQRGLARFVGISHGTLRGVIDTVVSGSSTIENLKSFSSNTIYLELLGGCDTSNVNNAVILTAKFCAAIIEYYAFDSKQAKSEKALFAFRKFAALGIEAFIQQQCGWKPPTIGKLTPKEIVSMLVLPEAKEWSLRFPKEYYDQLARLTGLTPVGHKRPTLWGKLTKEWIYDYLPQGVYDRLKELQTTHKGHPKLHQFLIEDTGIALLTEHYNALMTLMYASENIFQVSQLLQTRKNVTTKIFEAQQIKAIAAFQ